MFSKNTFKYLETNQTLACPTVSQHASPRTISILIGMLQLLGFKVNNQEHVNTVPWGDEWIVRAWVESLYEEFCGQYTKTIRKPFDKSSPANDCTMLSIREVFTYFTDEHLTDDATISLVGEVTFASSNVLQELVSTILNSKLPSSPDALGYLRDMASVGLINPKQVARHKETQAALNAIWWTRLGTFTPRYPDEVLRVFAVLADVHPSMNEKFKIVTLKRSQRRTMVRILENMDGSEYDYAIHSEMWKRVFHSLHINEHKPNDNLASIVSKSRSGTLVTFAAKMEAAIANSDSDAILNLVMEEKGKASQYFLRFPVETQMVAWKEMKSSISGKVIFSILGELRRRGLRAPKVIMPTAKSDTLLIDHDNIVPLLRTEIELKEAMELELMSRLQDGLGDNPTFYKNGDLDKMLLPSGTSRQNRGHTDLVRGSTYKLSLTPILTFGMGWKGNNDCDLSVVFFDENHNYISTLAWDTNERRLGDYGYHSGDVRSAPDGAAEFATLDIVAARKQGARFVTVCFNDYSGSGFDKLEDAYFALGVPRLDELGNVGNDYDIHVKVDVNQPCSNILTCTVDISSMEMTWLDIPVPGHANEAGFTASQNKMAFKGIAEIPLYIKDSRPTLGYLADLYIEANHGRVVRDAKDATHVFTTNLDSPYEDKVSIDLTSLDCISKMLK